MMLMMVIIGIGLVFYFNDTDKKILRETAVSIESLASRGHAMSVLNQKPFWIRFEENQVVLAGADLESTPVEDPDAPPAWASFGEEESETNEKIYDTYPSKATISVRRWGTRENAWIPLEKDQVVVWHFQSTGLCEPISIKLETEKSWMILHMNPLTARIDEEEMAIQ